MKSARVTRAAWSVFAAYAAAGFAIGTIASRVPSFRTGLDLTSSQTGVLLLFWALGSVLALPVAGAVTMRLGAARTLSTFALVAFVGHVSLATSVMLGWVPLAFAGFLVAGIGEGVWAASTGLEAAHVERELGYPAMPRFQAGESLGTVSGSAVGALLAATSLPLVAHMGLASLLAAVAALLAARSFLPLATTSSAGRSGVDGGGSTQRRGASLRSALSAWREPRTLLIGLVILGAALAEGAASDWTGVGLVHGFGATESTGAAGVTVFFAAMLSMRLFGSKLVERVGRVVALRLCAGAVLVGVALFALAPVLPLAMAGSFVWGLGAALGFPLGVSAASDDPMRAAMRVSVVTTIGYCAFIVGPAVIGAVAGVIGYRGALVVVAVPVVLGMVLAGAAKELDPASDGGAAPAPRPAPQPSPRAEAVFASSGSDGVDGLGEGGDGLVVDGVDVLLGLGDPLDREALEGAEAVHEEAAREERGGDRALAQGGGVGVR